MRKIFALADCNNFYVSCERVFNPLLRDKPVIVLSNNDGNIISRSNEAKELGLAMGAPFFGKSCFDNKIVCQNRIDRSSTNYERALSQMSLYRDSSICCQWFFKSGRRFYDVTSVFGVT